MLIRYFDEKQNEWVLKEINEVKFYVDSNGSFAVFKNEKYHNITVRIEDVDFITIK